MDILIVNMVYFLNWICFWHDETQKKGKR